MIWICSKNWFFCLHLVLTINVYCDPWCRLSGTNYTMVIFTSTGTACQLFAGPDDMVEMLSIDKGVILELCTLSYNNNGSTVARLQVCMIWIHSKDRFFCLSLVLTMQASYESVRGHNFARQELVWSMAQSFLSICVSTVGMLNVTMVKMWEDTTARSVDNYRGCLHFCLGKWALVCKHLN